MLRVTTMGNLGADAERRETSRGVPMVTFRIGVDQPRSNAGPRGGNETEWFRVNVMGRQVEYAANLKRGQWVWVVGRLQISHFPREGGGQGTSYDIWADEIQNLSARSLDRTDEQQAVPEPVGERDVAF